MKFALTASKYAKIEQPESFVLFIWSLKINKEIYYHNEMQPIKKDVKKRDTENVEKLKKKVERFSN